MSEEDRKEDRLPEPLSRELDLIIESNMQLVNAIMVSAGSMVMHTNRNRGDADLMVAEILARAAGALKAITREAFQRALKRYNLPEVKKEDLIRVLKFLAFDFAVNPDLQRLKGEIPTPVVMVILSQLGGEEDNSELAGTPVG